MIAVNNSLAINNAAALLPVHAAQMHVAGTYTIQVFSPTMRITSYCYNYL